MITLVITSIFWQDHQPIEPEPTSFVLTINEGATTILSLSKPAFSRQTFQTEKTVASILQKMQTYYDFRVPDTAIARTTYNIDIFETEEYGDKLRKFINLKTTNCSGRISEPLWIELIYSVRNVTPSELFPDYLTIIFDI